MTVSIDIDVGGTFTDALVTADGRVAKAKASTTSYNLSVGFLRALESAAAELGTDLASLLAATEMVRYSTTVAFNRLLERKGPRLGLVTTAGFEDTIYIGRGGQWADGLPVRERRNVARARRPEPLVPRDMTVGVRERVDSFGRVLAPLDEQDVAVKVEELVGRGARGLVVSLLWSHLFPDHERRVREIVREHYPASYLGSMPVVLSSEVLPRRDEYARTMTAILDAYLHQAMREELAGMRDELVRQGCGGPLMMIHASGGMAEVRKTSAVETCNGGPVAGLLGAAFVGSELGEENLILADMGGTSFDMGIVEGGRPSAHRARPLLDRWQVGIAMMETRSIGAGGGSIARLDGATGRVEVGPESAGSMPGPAAYDQGGEEPTVTDADVVLGYLNPETFHGGRLRLDVGRARAAIESRLARPLGLSIEAAAMLVRRVVDANAGHALFKETALRGHDPRSFALVACGGAGPTHACGFGLFAEVGRLITLPFSAVFCAFGSAHMDIEHVYEQSHRLQLLAPGGKNWLDDFSVFNQTVARLEERAEADFLAEGLPADDVVFTLQLDGKFGGQLNSKRFACPRLRLASRGDAEAVYQAFAAEYGRAFSPLSLFPAGGVELHHFVLHATLPTPRIGLPRRPLGAPTPSEGAVRPARPAYWHELGGFAETRVFTAAALEPGNRIAGPAILEAPDTTTVLPPGWHYRVHETGAGIIERERI
ncbi:MAG: hydantoinase/oxoprolinase family protein [Deltaproteobacteria bacterium]|nr:hydantoinase/oxoprolinase family protein [Deltaproteobacteria bacterium]